MNATTYTILDRDNNDAIVDGVDDLGHVLLAISKAIAATMDPHENGEPLGIGRSIDVEEETVFVALDVRDTGHGGIRLGADGAEIGGRNDGRIPRPLGQTGRLPSQIPGRRSGISNSGCWQEIVSVTRP